MKKKDVHFLSFEVPEGEIWIRKNGDEFECWTLGKRINYLVNFEFGIPRHNSENRETENGFEIFPVELSMHNFIDIVIANYEDGLLDFDGYYE